MTTFLWLCLNEWDLFQFVQPLHGLKKTVLLKFSMFPTSGFKLQLHLIPTYLYIFEEIRANFHFAQVAAAYYVHYSQMCIHFGLFSTFLSLCIPGVILCIQVVFYWLSWEVKLTYNTSWSDAKFHKVLAVFFWIALRNFCRV